MKVLAINCGSSTLKFHLIDMADEERPSGQEKRLAHGIVDRIGGWGTVDFTREGDEPLLETAGVADHGEAARHVLNWIESRGFMEPDGLGVIGHRVVHGGEQFVEPILIDDKVIDTIEALSNLAPLHNEPSLMAIRATRSALGPAVPMMAIFDTVFHRTMPERAYRYAIPQELAAKHHIRRYGFHGLAHRYMTERYAAVTSTPLAKVSLVTLQLGNGCSATAVEGGFSMDTSMGFTPLEGLMMGTRSGDVDPSLAGFLARSEGLDVEGVEGWLNTRSGLLGVSGRSQDMRELLEAESQGDAGAALAVEMFCYRVRKYIGAYMAVLDGTDAVVFGGGIGENAPAVRTRICAGMGWCGLILDQDRNAIAMGIEERISANDARVHAYVIPVDEGVIIVRDAVSCLRRYRRG